MRAPAPLLAASLRPAQPETTTKCRTPAQRIVTSGRGSGLKGPVLAKDSGQHRLEAEGASRLGQRLHAPPPSLPLWPAPFPHLKTD